MSAKHTPGPWEAVIHGGWDAPRIFSPSGSIALLQHHESGPAEAEANARLLAVAPDLLEALRDMLDWLDDGVLMAQDPELGAMPVQVLHDGLTHTQWRPA